MKDVFLTKEGVSKLKDELKKLISVDRKDVIKKIKETREYGDLSENAEYDAARAEQSMIEGRIEEIEEMLRRAKVIAPTEHKKGSGVAMGDTVKVESEGDEMEFMLVGSAESDPVAGKISVESPLGKGLLGSKSGESFTVEIIDGDTVEYKVLSIS